jgi:hypothetical protein
METNTLLQDGLFVMYLLILAGGVGWVIYRAKQYMESEKEREQQWAYMASDPSFKSFLDNLKTEQKDEARTHEAPRAADSRPRSEDDDSYRPDVYKLQ